ncbi:MAG: Panacea domain-containing protein [Candidatus Binatia bacterium]
MFVRERSGTIVELRLIGPIVDNVDIVVAAKQLPRVLSNVAGRGSRKGIRDMARAFDVARFLIQLAEWEDEPEYLSHLRLQKLLYYVQGWSLALRGKPMFNESIEAWAHGPVVKDLYPVFAGYGFDPIPPKDFSGEIRLTNDEKKFVCQVWESYKGYSATSLRAMTHQEPPWMEARRGYGPAARCNHEINHPSMKRFFSEQARQ